MSASSARSLIERPDDAYIQLPVFVRMAARTKNLSLQDRAIVAVVMLADMTDLKVLVHACVVAGFSPR
jgi:hypothetical protein